MANADTNKPIFTITGSDGTGGAGVQADIKMITALGGYAVSAITSITVQNTLGIQEFYDLPASTVTSQVETILNDVRPDIIKVGMLRRADVVRSLSEILRHNSNCCIIYDPVVCSAHGDVLMTENVIAEIKRSLLPLCNLVTIKKSDALHLLGITSSAGIDSSSLAQSLTDLGCHNVLIRNANRNIHTHNDLLMCGSSKRSLMFTSIEGNSAETDHHGKGSLLTSAIATFLGRGHDMDEAVGMAYNHVNNLAAAQMGLVGRSSELYNDFMDLLQQHCHCSNDVGYYAEHLNVSTRYLSQVTKRMADKTPKTIIDENAAQQAEILLSTSDKTIQEIAFCLGFSSQAHFTKFFKKIAGYTPSEYRKNKLNGGKIQNHP